MYVRLPLAASLANVLASSVFTLVKQMFISLNQPALKYSFYLPVSKFGDYCTGGGQTIHPS